jgi:hypothetical protein
MDEKVTITTAGTPYFKLQIKFKGSAGHIAIKRIKLGLL